MELDCCVAEIVVVTMTDEEAVENSSNDSLFLSMNQYNLINNDMCTQC
jgi:hypothetical protein